MARMTIAQWRREVPAYDRMYRDVVAVASKLPFGNRLSVIAHIDEDTRIVAFVLRVTDAEIPALRSLVGNVALEPIPGGRFWRGTPTDMTALRARLGMRR
jgi:hypothetical protein